MRRLGGNGYVDYRGSWFYLVFFWSLLLGLFLCEVAVLSGLMG